MKGIEATDYVETGEQGPTLTRVTTQLRSGGLSVSRRQIPVPVAFRHRSSQPRASRAGRLAWADQTIGNSHLDSRGQAGSDERASQLW